MIIKGGAAGNVTYWARHLLRDDTNESVALLEIAGLLAEDLPSALLEMQMIAGASRCRRNFLYQANINPRIGEELTRAEALKAFDLLGRNLGLAGHQRVIVEHVKNGRRHFHAIWNRVDVETLKVTDIGGNYRVHEQTARELERQLDHAPTPRPLEKRRTSPELWELRRPRHTPAGHPLTIELTRLWRSTDSGLGFKQALEARGHILARGDRRDFCIVDKDGKAHSLARRLSGVRVKDVRARLADIEVDSLPSVSEAQALQSTRGAAAASAQKRKAVRQWRARSDIRARTVRLAPARKPEAVSRAPSIVPPLRALAPDLNFGAVARALATPRANFRAAGAHVGPGPRRRSTNEPLRPSTVAIPAGSSRADAAFKHEHDKWERVIDALLRDEALSHDQVSAALLALRQRQEIDAKGARDRVADEERGDVAAAQREAIRLRGRPLAAD